MRTVDMFQCTVCGTMGRDPAACGMCGRDVTEVSGRASGRVVDASATRRMSVRGARIGTRLASIVVVILFSAVAAGTYVSTRPPSPSCANLAVNYPSCNACVSTETFNQTKNACSCTNEMANPPYCNRPCANNAINPPATAGGYSNISGGTGCDLCSDGQTDPPGGFCTAGMKPYGAEKPPARSQDRSEHYYL